jgi:hypothetical protein
MASGSESGGGNGTKLKSSTAASGRNPRYTRQESAYVRKSSGAAPF